MDAKKAKLLRGLLESQQIADAQTESARVRYPYALGHLQGAVAAFLELPASEDGWPTLAEVEASIEQTKAHA